MHQSTRHMQRQLTRLATRLVWCTHTARQWRAATPFMPDSWVYDSWVCDAFRCDACICDSCICDSLICDSLICDSFICDAFRCDAFICDACIYDSCICDTLICDSSILSYITNLLSYITHRVPFCEGVNDSTAMAPDNSKSASENRLHHKKIALSNTPLSPPSVRPAVGAVQAIDPLAKWKKVFNLSINVIIWSINVIIWSINVIIWSINVIIWSINVIKDLLPWNSMYWCDVCIYQCVVYLSYRVCVTYQCTHTHMHMYTHIYTHIHTHTHAHLPLLSIY